MLQVTGCQDLSFKCEGHEVEVARALVKLIARVLCVVDWILVDLEGFKVVVEDVGVVSFWKELQMRRKSCHHYCCSFIIATSSSSVQPTLAAADSCGGTEESGGGYC